MVIWARWGILGLLIPIIINLLSQAVLKPVLTPTLQPVKLAKPTEDTDDTPAAEDVKAFEAAKRKRDADHAKAMKRAEDKAFAIGCLISAVVLWPLGRWMNATESSLLVDVQTGQPVEHQVGGGHTLFFIPLQYWALIWPVIGLFKLAG